MIHSLYSVLQSQKSSETDTLLKDLPLFESLSAKEFLIITRMLHERHYRKDETIFHKEEPAAALYVITQGSVKILENAQSITTLQKGAFFGEMGLVDNAPRSADAIAQEPSTLLAFTRPMIDDLQARHPKIAVKLLLEIGKILSTRLRTCNQFLTAQS